MILTLMFYFFPMWITSSYYLIKQSNVRIAQRMFAWFLQAVAVFVIAFPFLHTFGKVPDVALMGIWNVWIWWVLFVVSIGIMKWKGYTEAYSILIGLIVTVIATEIWEIPTHVLTVSMTPTIEQVLITVMLSSPYLLLLVPLLYEAKKKNNVLTKELMFGFAFIPIVHSLTFLMLPLPSWMFQENGYVINDINYVIRIAWSIIFTVFLFGFPKVKKTGNSNGSP